MRFVFNPPADGAAELLDLPWETPLAEWKVDALVEVPTAGIHRHVVKFVETPAGIFVLKELPDDLVRREYNLLRDLAHDSIPAVEVVGACLDREGQDAILVTRFLAYSATYRRLLSTIVDVYEGGPVGIEALAATLAEPRDTIEDVYEPFLLQRGLLSRTPRGRMVTRKGYEHLGVQPPRRNTGGGEQGTLPM